MRFCGKKRVLFKNRYCVIIGAEVVPIIRRLLHRLFGLFAWMLMTASLITAGGFVGGVKAMYDINQSGHIILKKTTLAQGESIRVRLSRDDFVTWESSDQKILQVYTNNLSRRAEIRGISAGTALLTAKIYGHTYTQRITVTGERYHSPVRIDPLKYLKYKFKGKNGNGYVQYTTTLAPGDSKDLKKIFKHFCIISDDTGAYRNGQKAKFHIEYDYKFMDKYNVTFENLERTVRVHGLSYRMNHLSQKLRKKALKETRSEILWFGKGNRDIIVGIYQVKGYYHYAVTYNADSRGRFSWEHHDMNNIVSTDEAMDYIKANFASYDLEIA